MSDKQRMYVRECKNCDCCTRTQNTDIEPDEIESHTIPISNLSVNLVQYPCFPFTINTPLFKWYKFRHCVTLIVFTCVFHDHSIIM